MPTNQLAPPDMPWLTGNVASPPNPLGPPLLNYAAPPDATTSQGADVLAGKAQQAWQWLQDQRAESVRQGLLDPDTGLPTQAGLVQGVGQTAQGVMMGTTAPGDVPPPGIVAYHGSPHSFDQFDTSKIGTGEGAQAYGHGLYFAGNEGVAQAYRKNLSGPAPSFTGEIAPEFLEALKADDNLGFDNASQAIAAIRSHPDWPQRWDPTDPQKLQALFEAHEQSKYGGQGSMYQVNIGADPEHFLDWDKPRDQLDPNVQAFAKQNYPQAWEDAADGSSLYAGMVREHEIKSVYALADRMGIAPDASAGTSALQRLYSVKGQLIDGGVDLAPLADPHAALSQHMQAGGIPGIRYLDQGSRGAGQGTHNYVVFDANTIDILRKYGIAGLIAGGGAVAAGTQQQQPSQ